MTEGDLIVKEEFLEGKAASWQRVGLLMVIWSSVLYQKLDFFCVPRDENSFGNRLTLTKLPGGVEGQIINNNKENFILSWHLTPNKADYSHSMPSKYQLQCAAVEWKGCEIK